MKNITTSKYGTKRYIHRGVIVEQTGIEYTLWPDFVTESYQQPRVASLAAAKTFITLIGR